MTLDRVFLGLFVIFVVWMSALLWFPALAPKVQVSVRPPRTSPSPPPSAQPDAPATPTPAATVAPLPEPSPSPVASATPPPSAPPAVAVSVSPEEPESSAQPSPPPSQPAAPETAAASPPAGALWTTDHKAAQARAKAENKPLMLLFSGSDWCSVCKKLDAEVLSTEAFQKYAAEKLVLVMLDFPRRKPQSDALRQQNTELQAAYGVVGFPTIILCDSNGAEVAQLGYMPGGAAAMIGAIKMALAKKD